MAKVSGIATAVALVFALLAPPLAPPVSAAETGFAGIHPWRKVGKKTCLVGHQHAGAGNGNSLKEAQARAVGSWSSFTDLEYGDSWANFNLAVEKIMRCGPIAGSGYQCDLSATPCRPY